MGFFAEIIRDSRSRGIASRAAEAPRSRGGEDLTADVLFAASDRSVIRLREEGGGQPESVGQRPLQSGTDTRQVVGPSPSEHTPLAGLPEAIQQGVTPPIPGKREQAGSESDRTATGEFRVEQTESFLDDGSNDVPVSSVSANDSSIRESSSGYAASRTGKVSVETQGRRQAGVTRAGSTTPPELLSGQAVETPLTPAADEPAAGAPRQAAVPAPRVPDTPQNALPAAVRAGHTVPTEGVAEETVPSAAGVPRSARLPGSAALAEEMRPAPPAAPLPVSAPAHLPGSEERSPRSPKRERAPFPRGGEENGTPSRSLPPREPQVRIGTIEVVVLAPAPAEHPPRSEERSRTELASRHYLRNF